MTASSTFENTSNLKQSMTKNFPVNTAGMDYQGGLQDIFYIPRILGAFPFDGQSKLSKKWLIYSCVVRIVSAILAVLASIYFIYNELDGFFTKILIISTLSIDVGENIFVLYWWILKQDSLSLLMEKINEIQRRQRSTLEMQKIRLVHYYLVLALTSYVVIAVTHIVEEDYLCKSFMGFWYFLVHCSTVSFVGQFWDILHVLGQLLQGSTQLYDESSVINYERFSALFELANGIYGLQVLVDFTKSFVQIIANLYLLLLPVQPGINSFNINAVIRVINCVVTIGSIVQACDYYTQQEQRFNDELRTRIIDDKSRVLLKKEKLYFHFLARRESVFTACGLFSVDKSLICSMTSAATTYLLVVLQFGSDDKISSSTSE